MGIIQENCPELDNMYMTIGSSMVHRRVQRRICLDYSQSGGTK